MSLTALFIIESSPHQSARAVEGLRIAAGVGAWQKVRAEVFLGEAALELLSTESDFPLDDAAEEWLHIITQGARPILVPGTFQVGDQQLRAGCVVQRLSDAELAGIAARSKFLLRF